MHEINDPYCYPGTEVLKNKLGIQDEEELLETEKILSMLRLTELIKKPLRGSFDFQHLCRIHHYIFQDLYVWAGKIRTVNIGKGNMFCHVEFIAREAQKLFEDLKSESSNTNMSLSTFTERSAYYFSEINAIHPFREGNGRAQREFMRIFAIHCGFKLEFSKISRSEMLKASQESFVCNYKPMTDIFRNITTKL